MKTYEKSIQKRIVRDLQLSEVSNIRSSILSLLGPNPLLPLKEYTKYSLISRKQDKVISYEISPIAFNKQFTEVAQHPYYKNKTVLFMDNIITQQLPPRFVDLDLMATIKTEAETIKLLFNRQHYYHPEDQTKVFLFTVAARKAGINFVVNFLRELLGLPYLKVFNTIKINSVTRHILINTNQYHITMYGYADGGPMLSISIQYN